MNFRNLGWLPLSMVMLITWKAGGYTVGSVLLGVAAVLFAMMYALMWVQHIAKGPALLSDNPRPGLYGVYNIRKIDAGKSLLVLAHRANQADATEDDYFLFKLPVGAVGGDVPHDAATLEVILAGGFKKASFR